MSHLLPKLLPLIALLTPLAATAQTSTGVTLKSDTYVARSVTAPDGSKKNDLFAATRVLPGDPLVFILSYANQGAKPASAFVINNKIPDGVAYTGAEQPWAVVSVDGGKAFGPLTSLRVKKADGSVRAAVAQDVTHIRWTFAQPIAVGASGRVMFYAVVK